MLIEVFCNRERVQAFANAAQEPIEYSEREQCGRWYEDIQSHGHWSAVMAKIYDLSHRFRLIVHDSGIDGLGPSVFCQPSAPFKAYYRVELEDGQYRILDEHWTSSEMGEGGIFTIYRVKNGVHYDLPLVEESPDPDDYCTMLVHKSGDDLSAIPDVPNITDRPDLTSRQFHLILPENGPPVDSVGRCVDED